MSLLQRFIDFIHQQNLFSSKERLVLAVSGGIDSVVLCELCRQAGYDFAIAHCNFQLRGEESERDEHFVKGLGVKYDVQVWTKKFDTERYAQEKKIGIQEAARDLRYDWFKEIVNGQWSIVNEQFSDSTLYTRLTSHVLTAHHADDNIETVLMNFCRGTGLQGLEGIPVKSNHICRPLLMFWKEELIQFAKDNKLDFVEDSSNQSSKYTRNLFRNEVVPLISKAYPQVKENLVEDIERFKEINSLYKLSVEEIKKRLCRRKNKEVHIPIAQLMSYQNRALIFEIISDYGFTERQIDEVIKLAESESGKFIQSPGGSFRIIKFRNWFIISEYRSSGTETIIIDENTKQVEFENRKLKIENVALTSDFRLSPSHLIACFDAKEIAFPLIIRKWKQGDYFYPLGMRKKKKLARFFIDQKLSKTEKEEIWVIEMNKKILWIAGMRIDDRFKITEKTKSVFKISLETV